MTSRVEYQNAYPIGSIWKCTKNKTIKYIYIVKYGIHYAPDHIIGKDMKNLLGPDINFYMQFDHEHFMRVA